MSYSVAIIIGLGNYNSQGVFYLLDSPIIPLLPQQSSQPDKTTFFYLGTVVVSRSNSRQIVRRFVWNFRARPSLCRPFQSKKSTGATNHWVESMLDLNIVFKVLLV
jgi:hypothetical protein